MQDAGFNTLTLVTPSELAFGLTGLLVRSFPACTANKMMHFRSVGLPIGLPDRHKMGIPWDTYLSCRGANQLQKGGCLVAAIHLHPETERSNTNFLPLSTFTHHQPSDYHHIAMDLLSKDQRLQLAIEAGQNSPPKLLIRTIARQKGVTSTILYDQLKNSSTR